MTGLRGAAIALLLGGASLASALPQAAAQPAAPVTAPSLDPDAQCLMLMRGYAMGVQRESSNAVGTWETAFAYYAGRLLARHQPDAITPLAAAALQADPPEADRYAEAQRCRAAAVQLLTGDQVGRAPANAAPAAADAPRDPDAYCLRLMRVAFQSLMQAMRGGQAPGGQLRGLMIAQAYYTGRLAALRGEAVIEALTAAAYREGQPHAEVEADATRCYGGGADAARAINRAVNAALPTAATSEGAAGTSEGK